MTRPDRYATADSYEDSDVLINRFGIRDHETLHSLERKLSFSRGLSTPTGKFDYGHLKAIHRHLFQDLYEWAGEERNVPIHKGTTTFATTAYLSRNAQRLFTELRDKSFLRGLSRADFADQAAEFIIELNMLHPFREGNGRVLRIFLHQLARRAGHALVPERLEREAWLRACEAGVHDHALMAQLITRSLADPA